MTKLKLTIGERFMTTRLLNEEGSGLGFDALKNCLKIADKVAVDELEKKNYKFSMDEKGAHWNEKKSEKDVEFNQDEYKLLLSFIDGRDRKKNFSLKEGSFMVSLVNKLKEAKDE